MSLKLNDINIIEKNNNYFVKLNNKTYKIMEEAIGVTSNKFWLVDIETNKKVYLFKENTRDRSMMAAIEVLTHQLLQDNNVDSAEYVIAELYDSGMRIDGVLTKNFIDEDNEYFITGKDFLRSHLSYLIENGLPHPEMNAFSLNYVYDYLKFIPERYPNENINLEKIKLDLLKIAVFDYLRGQTDRHATNIGFLVNTNEGISSLRVAPVFDNSLTLSNKFTPNYKKIYLNEHISLNDLNHYFKVQDDISNLIKNTNVRLAVKRFKENELDSYMPDQPKAKSNKFLEDIALEILNNNELKEFYENLINNDTTVEKLRKIQSYYPKIQEFDIDFEKVIFESRTDLLQKQIKKLSTKNKNANISEQPLSR